MKCTYKMTRIKIELILLHDKDVNRIFKIHFKFIPFSAQAIVRLRKANRKPVTESKENNSNITISTSEILNSLWACFNETASQS